MSVEYVIGNGEVGYLQKRNCSKYIFGIQYKNKQSTPVLLANSSIDKITMIEHEFFYPLLPIYTESCYIITGNAELTLEERTKKQNSMDDRNKIYQKSNK